MIASFVPRFSIVATWMLEEGLPGLLFAVLSLAGIAGLVAGAVAIVQAL
jgi:hypothetical protein